jgi:NAD(P)-dependent dehydrogenase (short-subunit alcohol dehydrogenase family)
MKLENRVSIVTGGAKGMGRDISLTLAREGADLVLASRDTNALEKVANEVRLLGRSVEVVGTDVTNDNEVAAMVKQTLSVFDGRIDILVNVAGIPGPYGTSSPQLSVRCLRSTSSALSCLLSTYCPL